MSDRNTPDTDNGAIKDPAEWTTGDEPMTGAQDSYLRTLARKAGEEVEEEPDQGRGVDEDRRAAREGRRR